MNVSAQQAAVESYWKERGYAVKTWEVDTGARILDTKSTLKVLRSDMINGYPLAALADALKQPCPNRKDGND